jgi:PIN domain nuclease of toxin-antitoxin system
LRILLDTHMILWWLGNDPRLGDRAREIVEDPVNDILISVVSLWEIVVKIRIGKLEADFDQILRALEAEAFGFLAIQPAHLHKLSGLPMHHRDPFDHLLIAQALSENMLFMTGDRHAALYPARIIRCSGEILPGIGGH